MKRTMLAWLTGILLLLTGQSAMAATGGGAEPVPNGPQSDVYAGVVVDYMGKLRFLVLEEGTDIPIPGASVEIAVPKMDSITVGESYVLFGVTDENGILDIEVAHSQTGQSPEIGPDGGSVLYTSDSTISYRIYKFTWLPYPKKGKVELKTEEIPQVETVRLHKEPTVSGGGSGGGGSTGGSAVKPMETVPDQEVPGAPLESDAFDEGQNKGVPKTGIEGTAPYWVAGLLFFLIAGGIAVYLLKQEKDTNKKQH